MQLDIRTTNLGWGDLADQLSDLKSLQEKMQTDEQKVLKTKSEVHRLITEMNEKRRERVFALLKAEKRLICLSHRLVFVGATTEEFLVPEEQVTVVQMYRSWTVTHGCYDGDKEYSTESAQYETVACKLCQSVLSHGNVRDKSHVTRGMMQGQKPSTRTVQSFYSPEIEMIDKISAEYFQMPIVTFQNLQSLI